MKSSEEEILIEKFMGFIPYYNIVVHEYGSDYKDWYETYDVMYCNMPPNLIRYEETFFGKHVAWHENYFDRDEQPEGFDYHFYANSKTWNDLIPIVEKIESLGWRFVIAEKQSDIFCKKTFINLISTQEGKDKKEATLLGILEFIKWWNKQNKL